VRDGRREREREGGIVGNVNDSRSEKEIEKTRERERSERD